MTKTREQAIDLNKVLLYLAAVILLVLAVFSLNGGRGTVEGIFTADHGNSGQRVAKEESEDDIEIKDETARRSITA